ncbi:putative RNA-directed DNA polymerase [Tanacetum coccineum]
METLSQKSGGEKAPGSDGFTFKLLKKHWDVFSSDIISYVKEFETKEFIPKGCNSSFIDLVLKVDEPVSLNDYRPISLIGCQYKIIAKLLANRLVKVISSVISEVQTAFIKGRQIIDGHLIVDEIISWAKHTKRKMFFLKVDFEKAIDSLNWSFLDSIMTQMGFSIKWKNWISACLNSSYASVLVNGSPTPEFKIEKGLRQGDPLSPFLFILAIKALNVVLEEAKSRHFFWGIDVGSNRVHISHLQFADDAIILGEWSHVNVKNLSRILTCFHLASGLKVNFNKSKFFGVGVTNNELTSLASTVGCQSSHFPCNYLGLPIGANMSRSSNWSPLIDRFHKQISMWKANSISFGGRLTLIKVVLGSLGVYYFSIFKAPKCIFTKLECIIRKFFWGGSSDSNKIPWIAWDKVIAPFDKGGLNIRSLKVCEIAKLNRELNVLGIDLYSIFKLKIGNGQNTHFWTDMWVGNAPLFSIYPRLFRIEGDHNFSVSERTPFCVHSQVPAPNSSCLNGPVGQVLSVDGIRPINTHRLSFQWNWQRPLRPCDLTELAELQSLLSNFRITSSKDDRWECLLDITRNFTVKGMRCLIVNSSIQSYSTPTRRNKLVPIKINIASWRMENRRIPTRVNLDHIGVDLDSVRCHVCDNDLETEDHILVKFEVAASVWVEVLNWWNINHTHLDNLNDVLSIPSLANLSSMLTSVLDAVVQSTLWILWRFRNDSAFAPKRPNRRMILNDVKLFTFNWISNRLRNISFNWIEWLFNPCNALSTPLYFFLASC